ncbi:hypothetical protein LWI28_013968 [Acer negundo]|uniref:Reverse transcriptase zinc-binding domain-containing protein n=1 Tax=Acer negundo TaxID=4023 RepID=A0AAD5ILN7_ACENE|nr:hypothetical protein LWI28_013968 [Acer negundo]
MDRLRFFQNMWTSYLGFLDMVGNSWTEHMVSESGLHRLVGKLKRMKQKLRVWNKETFGRVDGFIKAVFNCLSVDEKVRNVGVPIVSACNCCSSRGIEDLDHILNNGDFVSNLWRKVLAEVEVPFLAHRSWKGRVQQ